MGSPSVRVLLSGGIGSGKTSVSRSLRELGIPVLDADQVGHDVLEPDGEAFERVAARWPEIIGDGRVDRRHLGRIVFRNPALLVELEGYTHPAIRSRLDQEVAALCSREVVVEMPLPKDFMGPGWLRAVVDVPDRIRIKRLQERGMELDEIESRMSSQPSAEEWRHIADYVIDNSGDEAHLEEEISAFVQWMHSASEDSTSGQGREGVTKQLGGHER